jgi:hypothetical protein
MANRNWSKEEHDALVKLAEAGYTTREIYNANVFERSYNAIFSHARDSGISLAGREHKIDRDRLKELLDGANRQSDSKIRKA